MDDIFLSCDTVPIVLRRVLWLENSNTERLSVDQRSVIPCFAVFR